MRKLLTGFILVLVTGVCQAQSRVIFRDPGDAWPWGAELPFPWKGIQGTWTANIRDEKVLFSFETVRSSKGVNQLQVIEYRAKDCAVVAHGAGYEEDRVVNALMVTGTSAFNMTVHVFRESDLRISKGQGLWANSVGGKTVTVMNMTPLGGTVSTGVTYELTKIAADPEGLCTTSY